MDAPSLYLGPVEDRSSKPVATFPSASTCHLPNDCINLLSSLSVMLLTTTPASALLTFMSLYSISAGWNICGNLATSS